jgi:queuosine precursor transporter
LRCRRRPVQGDTGRVFIGASLAFLVSQILNAYVIVKIKALTHGRHFYVRALAATIVSELAHTLVVAPIMFASILTLDKLFHLIFVSTGVKILVELAALPFTYVLILKLKKLEGIDFYDT